MPEPGMRLGVYADLVYRRDGDVLSTDQAFVRFVTSLPPRVSELRLFGRLHPEPGREPYVVPPAVRFVPLPHYPRVTHGLAVLRALRRSLAVFEREAAGLDAVWLFGPHPLSLLFARAARRQGVRVVLGIRQDFPRYVSGRLAGPARAATPVVHALELAFRRLSRGVPTVALGADLAGRYGSPAPVHATGFSLTSAADVVAEADAVGRARDWGGEIRVLSVGRLDPEKNPLLLADVAAALGPRFLLDVVGWGPLEDALRARATALGVADRLVLHGHVENGPALWERYRSAHVFLHVSLTEGLPQVLVEAAAAGLPIVATDVGGVRAALAGGSRGLLVPPRDAGAAAEAIRRLAGDEEIRVRLVRAGLEAARRETMEAQLDAVARFLRAR